MRTDPPAAARAMRAAAASSGTSPGSGQAMAMSEMPASCRARISSADRTRPLRKDRVPWRTPWARIAPAAPVTGKRPNCMSAI